MKSSDAKFRKPVLIATMMAIVLFVLPVGLVVVVDPDHIFHKALPWMTWHQFDSYTHVQNAGLINSYLADKDEGFDAILVGSSVSENFRPGYFSGKTPWNRVMKLTLPAAEPPMQKMLVDRSIATSRVKHVFWEVFSNQYPYVDADTFSQLSSLHVENIRKHETAYLYNASRLDDYRYVLNYYSLSSSARLLAGNNADYDSDIDHIRYWGRNCYRDKNCYIYTAHDNLARIRSEYVAKSNRLSSYKPDGEAGIDYFMLDTFLLDTVKAYCGRGVSFDLYFPPVTLLWYASMDEAEFNYHFYMPRHVIQSVSGCSNVRVFGFNNDMALTGDLSNYHDKHHYRGEINDLVVDAFASGQYQITSSNLAAYERAMLDNLDKYIPFATVIHGKEDPAIYESGD